MTIQPISLLQMKALRLIYPQTDLALNEVWCVDST